MKKLVLIFVIVGLMVFLTGCSTEYTVEFETNGGSVVNSQTVEEGSLIQVPISKREGYIIEGWYLSVNDGQTLDEKWSFSSNTIQNDMKLYANWHLNDFLYEIQSDEVSIKGYIGLSKDITIPSTINGFPVTSIADNAFKNEKIIRVVFPDTIERIGDEAFYNNELTDVFLPKNLSEIGDRAFDFNYIVKVSIPKYVSKIGNGAFRWSSLDQLDIDSEEFIIENGLLFSKNKKDLIGGIGNLDTILIPVGVLEIKPYAFFGNRLLEVTIPSTTVSLGESAFASNRLINLVLPNNLEYVGESAFKFNNLRTIEIPTSVINIGTMAFEDNYYITDISIDGDVTRFNDEWEDIGFPEELKPES